VKHAIRELWRPRKSRQPYYIVVKYVFLRTRSDFSFRSNVTRRVISIAPTLTRFTFSVLSSTRCIFAKSDDRRRQTRRRRTETAFCRKICPDDRLRPSSSVTLNRFNSILLLLFAIVLCFDEIYVDLRLHKINEWRPKIYSYRSISISHKRPIGYCERK